MTKNEGQGKIGPGNCTVWLFSVVYYKRIGGCVGLSHCIQIKKKRTKCQNYRDILLGLSEKIYTGLQVDIVLKRTEGLNDDELAEVKSLL